MKIMSNKTMKNRMKFVFTFFARAIFIVVGLSYRGVEDTL